jgi:hypothetical protein
VSSTDFATQGDYDGDGRTDVGIWRDPEGRFYVRQSSNGALQVVAWGASGDFPIANYDTH